MMVLFLIFAIGLVRFATEKYTANLNLLNKQFIHLTNYSVNKYSDKYVENNMDDSVTILNEA